MKIALIGYGKMGKEIESEAIASGDDVVLKINKQNIAELNSINLKTADVAIEFTQPAAAFFNISKCFDTGIPVVVGTTGWYDKLDEIKEQCAMKNGSMLFASNFSIGVNIFFELNKKLTTLMKRYNEYNVSLEEIHHLQKLDKPSGTAITLAKDIMAGSDKFKSWSVDANDIGNKEKLFINSVRKENVVGTHIVKYDSDIDRIEIRHEAFSRKGFAKGALVAAKWLIGKKGVYEMKDLLMEV